MEIIFQTKEESNHKQRENFLKLSGAERVLAFLRFSAGMSIFPSKHPRQKKDNFVIKIMK